MIIKFIFCANLVRHPTSFVEFFFSNLKLVWSSYYKISFTNLKKKIFPRNAKRIFSQRRVTCFFARPTLQITLGKMAVLILLSRTIAKVG